MSKHTQTKQDKFKPFETLCNALRHVTVCIATLRSCQHTLLRNCNQPTGPQVKSSCNQPPDLGGEWQLQSATQAGWGVWQLQSTVKAGWRVAIAINPWSWAVCATSARSTPPKPPQAAAARSPATAQTLPLSLATTHSWLHEQRRALGHCGAPHHDI